jgi:hypothetical protein
MRLSKISMAPIVLVILAIALLSANSVAQPKTKNVIIGSWTHTSGSDNYDFGEINDWQVGLKGMLTFDNHGRFSMLLIGSSQPELKSANARRPDAEVVASTGTYTVNETDQRVIARIEADSYSPRIGMQLSIAVSENGERLDLLSSPLTDPTGAFSAYQKFARAK